MGPALFFTKLNNFKTVPELELYLLISRFWVKAVSVLVSLQTQKVVILA